MQKDGRGRKKETEQIFKAHHIFSRQTQKMKLSVSDHEIEDLDEEHA